MARNSISGVGLAATGIGSVLLYAGIKGYSTLAVVQNLVTGKPILTDVTQTVPLTAPVQDSTTGGWNSSANSNQDLAKQMAVGFGWDSGAEWDALVKLWERESSWNNHADNPSSHAYGIAQALPYSKMPKPGWPESAGGNSDPATQIAWGLSYIAGRYGSPTMAWAHETSNGWY